jgi:Fe2+ transport system protein B
VALHIAARSDDGLHAPGGLGPRAAALAILEGDDDVMRAVGISESGFLTEADEGLALEISKARHAEARALAAAAQTTGSSADRWWRLTTAPRTGIPILLGVIAAVFATLFIVGDLLARAHGGGRSSPGGHRHRHQRSSATARS